MLFRSPARLVFQTQAVPAAVAALALGLLLAVAFGSTGWGATVYDQTPASIGTAPVAATLFGPWLLAFEIASVLILAAVIGGVYLAAKRPNEDEEAG